MFESYIAQAPSKCIAIVDKAKSLTDKFYLIPIYDGYAKAWYQSEVAPVEKLLNLALSILSDEKSMPQEVAKSIFRFISVGVRNDNRAFDPIFNSLCHKILKSSVAIIKPQEFYQNSYDSHSRAINEPRGVLFEAAILFALREARMAYDIPNQKVTDELEFKKAWSNLYEIIEEPLKNQNSDEISLFVHIGYFYRYLSFLNDSWLDENFDLICPPGDDKLELRAAFISGYRFVRTYLKEVYMKLYEKGHLKQFLEIPDKKNYENNHNFEEIRGHVISIAIASFLFDYEDLENGFLREILDIEQSEILKLLWTPFSH